MTDTLRNQLLGLGFKPAPKPERKPPPRPARQARDAVPAPKAGTGKGKSRPGRHREEIDLAKAYAIRSQREKDERIRAEREKQEAARVRREARAKLKALIEGKALNDAGAEIARHFEYGGKIKRVYVNAKQLEALNAGELGVLQQEGHYLLVDAALLVQAEAIFPQAVALKVDPDAPVADDRYADPQYQVPDDLVW